MVRFKILLGVLKFFKFIIKLNIICLILIIFILFGSCNTTNFSFFKKMEKNEFYNSKIIKNKLITESVLLCSQRFNIRQELLISIIYWESGFQEKVPDNINKNGTTDHGVMQLNSRSFPALTMVQFYDVEVNIFNGSKHLKELLDRFNGNELKAVCAYNTGANSIYNNYMPSSTLDYANNVIRYSYELEMRYNMYVFEVK